MALVIAAVWQVAMTSAIATTRHQVSIPVQGERSLSGELFLPDGSRPAPAVLVLHTAAGYVETFDSASAQALATAGFVALAVNYDSKRGAWAPGIDDDLVAVVKWLKSREEVKGKPVGAVGFSLGSYTINVAARDSDLKAVVVYYGTYNPRQSRNPNLPLTSLTPFDVAGRVEAAVLLLHGEADDEIPVSEAQAMRAALAGAGKTVELVTYPGAHHRFDRGPTANMRSEKSPRGSTFRKDDAAAKDAFQRTIDWLKKHLGS
jgi:dienelactone hydrolase